MAYQDIFKRYELKFLLSPEQYRVVRSAMDGRMKGDKYGESDICNLYCDTPDFILARRSNEKPFYKEKLRIRSYGIAKADSDVFVEIKKKYDSVVYKRRIVTDEETAIGMLDGDSTDERQIAKEITYFARFYAGIRPQMFISYRREAFYGIDDKSFRMTFDRSILWRTHDLTLQRGIYGAPVLPEGKILMEVKTAAAIPLWLVKVLSENKIYKTSFSKYGTAYIMMQSDISQGGQKVA
ncbi:MAG: polyphosphate polymerase domain-containing protein [Clostridiales bacterium]|nr:polyphosphate polymerase domain-containing protein [Clostridiales bacterium]